MASCSHINDLASLRAPRLADSVHREECTQCFDNQDAAEGVEVCLTCFNGGCLSTDRHHAQTHQKKSGHPFTLNIRRVPKPTMKRIEDEEPPAKMTKLAIVEESEADKFNHVTTLKCWKCNPERGRPLEDAASEARVKELADGVMQSMSSARQSEVKAWEEEITACEHTLTLQQFDTGHILPSGLAQCKKCDLKENLWLCLTCGSLGCGRKQFGGVGGNGHGLEHFEETGHAASIKLGTITPEGGADIYCYLCNDSRLDPELRLHLATFGINIAEQTKTEKSMTELQIEHNLKFDFSLTDESGKALQPVFGPGLTGLQNLGNSCYMASVIQMLFSLPSFRNRYHPSAADHAISCREPLPANCVDCQMHKLADGLISGRYSHPRGTAGPPLTLNPLAHDSPTPEFQEGVRPMSFKSLIGKGHEEFSTMRQQDSEEFLSHLLKVLRQQTKKAGRDEALEPTEVFKFGMEQRLACNECSRVRYKLDPTDLFSVPVPVREKGVEEGKTLYEGVELLECLAMVLGDEALEYKCPACNKNVVATKRTRFATFPEVLVLHAKKFQLVNWVPTKLDIPINIADELVLDPYLSTGLQPDEVELPHEAEAAPALPEFNAVAMAQLEGMGFPTLRCQKALLATGNSDPEDAMEWLFAHMEDPDIDVPIQPRGAPSGSEPSAEQVANLTDMGFTSAQAKKALRETGNSAERAIEWLFSHPDEMGEDAPESATAGPSTTAPVHPGGSAALPAQYRLKAFISHKGPSVHSGHYVAHIRVDPFDGSDVNKGWVLFNDEKVVRADAESVRELKQLAYLYVFERVSSI